MIVGSHYQRGKGTYIKGFGTFTYKRQALNLEGTTNEYFRDKREEEPVFIVSKELNRECMPGEYEKFNTIKFFKQKENKNIPIIKINYSEIAFRLSMSKDEVENIITHLIKNIGESISTGEFKNKIMTNLGVLFCKYKIIAMKFNENLVSKIKEKNQKLIIAKKNICMNMEINPYKTVSEKEFMNTYNSFDDLRATNSLNKKLEKTGYEYLKNKYNIDVIKYPQHELKNIYNNYEQNNGFINFINDFNPKKIKSKINGSKDLLQSPLFSLDEDIIISIEYYKGILIFKKF